jgi:hypothetical protein
MQKAAEALSKRDIQALMDKMRVLNWMAAIALALTVATFVKVFFY